jgi:hypothetical protein
MDSSYMYSHFKEGFYFMDGNVELKNSMLEQFPMISENTQPLTFSDANLNHV